MNGYLLDTNVISELTKKLPSPRVIEFLSEHGNLWLSTIVIHELEFGLQLLPQGNRRYSLQSLLSEFIAGIEQQDHVLPLGRKEAELAARLRSQARRSGRVLQLGDALIAGTAKAHDLLVATRNTEDFAGLDIKVENPWE
ncbi:MAG: type II toxin-antitoxin system VapC family toxin [Candidatus Dadabacteria bacterium]|nr:type II toxin-antitoxin system VapC family toxin [Candidatus Dadabacteria bacterium]MDE0663316.1 type II toxin-antitoxin system VapC family toxin [Candidatus Dadabacteria bacterium]